MSVNNQNYQQAFQALAVPGNQRLARAPFVNPRMVGRILYILVEHHHEWGTNWYLTRNEVASRLGVQGGNRNNHAHSSLNYCEQDGFIESGYDGRVIPTAKLLERTNLGMKVALEYDLVEHMGGDYRVPIKELISFMEDGNVYRTSTLKRNVEVWGQHWWAKAVAYMATSDKFETHGSSAFSFSAAMYPQGMNAGQVVIDPNLIA